MKDLIGRSINNRSAARRSRMALSCALMFFFSVVRIASAADAPGAPTTRPAEIPLPSQFSDDEHLCVDLAPAEAAAQTGDDECVGTISVGGRRSDRKFPLRGRVEAGVLKGAFTDDLGNSFSFTARLDADAQVLVFQTGQTTYSLPRAQGNPGIFRMMLLPVSDGFQIQDVVKDGPAERAGVRAGDVITAVDGTSAAGIDSSALGLRGFVGTQVKITLRHTDGSSETLSLQRAPFDRRNFGVSPAPAVAPSRGDRNDASRDR